MKKETYDINGMTCSACSARIEKGLSKMDGIENVSVNLLTNSMKVEFDDSLNSTDIIKKVEDIGYGAKVHSNSKAKKKDSINAVDNEFESMKNRLVLSLIFTVALFYIAMGPMINLPVPKIFNSMNHLMVAPLTQLLLTIPVLIAGRKYFEIGLKNIFKLSPNMDSLIALGSGSAFIYSLYATYKIAYALEKFDVETAHHFAMSLYFESAAMILALITLGKFFEAKAKNKTSTAITSLMNLAPKKAIVLRDEVEEEIDVDDVVMGDILIVKVGDTIPVDGKIISGYSSIDESYITGESIPVEKFVGDKVIGGTINKSGYFKMEATEVGENTTLSKIINLVEEATSSKAPIAKLADKISGIFVPIVMFIALCAFLYWYMTGHGFEFALSVGISVLVISCPCALGLATPTAIMVGTGLGAQKKILIKSAQALERAHSIQTVVLDKTGTITKGKPVVTNIISSISEKELLKLAASIEKLSSHPLADAIVQEAESRNIEIVNMENFKNIDGRGIKATYKEKEVLAGNYKFMSENNIDTTNYKDYERKLALDGKTPLYFATENKILGIIAVADTIKESSKEAVSILKKMGIEVIMLTGDNERTANAIGKSVGIDKVISDVLPSEKEEVIEKLQDSKKIVAMVGDGVNDAVALSRSDVGIAIGAGTDVAIESADIVLMKNDLLDVASAISLSKAVIKNIKENLFWAFIYNVIGIPVAAGILYKSQGILLNPMIAAAAMSFSSISVVSNALRLKMFKPKFSYSENVNNHENEKIEVEIINTSDKLKDERKVNVMKKTINIEGMNCGHCTASVEKALKSIEGVKVLEVSLENKNAVVESDVENSVLKNAIEEEGFEVKEIK